METNELSPELQEAMRLLSEAWEVIAETVLKMWEEIQKAFQEWLKAIHTVAVWFSRYFFRVRLQCLWHVPSWLAALISRCCPERWLPAW